MKTALARLILTHILFLLWRTDSGSNPLESPSYAFLYRTWRMALVRIIPIQNPYLLKAGSSHHVISLFSCRYRVSEVCTWDSFRYCRSVGGVIQAVLSIINCLETYIFIYLFVMNMEHKTKTQKMVNFSFPDGLQG